MDSIFEHPVFDSAKKKIRKRYPPTRKHTRNLFKLIIHLF